LRQGRLPSARQLQSRLGRLEACLSDDVPAALKYALSLLGLMQPNTRLPIVELNEADKARVACALAAVTADDLIEAAEA
jgi:4-hydroxy-tetrahydrodipicolinate synthase